MCIKKMEYKMMFLKSFQRQFDKLKGEPSGCYYKAGKEKALNSLVGAVMEKTKGEECEEAGNRKLK